MDLRARVGWGIVIYAVAFLAWAGMGIYGWAEGTLSYFLELVVLAAVCIWAGYELKFQAWKDILPYSIGWALIAAAFSALFTAPLEGWSWYGQWSTWALYLLITLLPLFSIFFREQPAASERIWES